jgi:HEAT repeat protein
MTAQQLDLFAIDGVDIEADGSRAEPALDPTQLINEELIAALPDAGLNAASSLAAEAARRRLTGAVPSIEKLCRRLIGFGADRLVPEQVAALEALANIGGEAARQTVARLIAHRIVQGPTLATALNAAARLGSSLPPSRLGELMEDADPTVRAAACRCVRSAGRHLGLLIELLDDLRPEVATAAALALGRIGRVEARPLLMSLLRREPSAEVVGALAPIADEEVIVTLGRIARAMPDLANAVLDALDQLDDPRAARIGLTLQAQTSALRSDART